MGDSNRLDAAIAACLSTLVFGGAASAQEIDWRVVDRFRLFLSEDRPTTAITAVGPTSSQDALLFRLRAIVPPGGVDEPRHQAALEELTRFLRTPSVIGPPGSAPALPYLRTQYLYPQRRQPTDRRYAPDYLYPRAYHVAARVSGAGFAPGAICRWSAPNLQAHAAPCSEEVRIPVPADGRGGRIRVRVESTGGGVPLEPEIVVRDRLIVSLGESFAAGEGNPDEPANLRLLDGRPGMWNSDSSHRWWLEAPTIRKLKAPGGPNGLAQWWDPWCHRSLFSQHMVAALAYAARRPHEAVTFASFACSGAGVLNGSVLPQAKPPGAPEFGRPPAVLTQIEAVQQLRCPDAFRLQRGAADLVAKAREAGISPAQVELVRRSGTTTTLVSSQPCARPPRPVDLLLLSMGGNDVGFAGAIQDNILPEKAADGFGNLMLKLLRDVLNTVPSATAEQRVRYGLQPRYDLQRYALRQAFGAATPVVQSVYPDPLRSGTGDWCGGPPDAEDNKLLKALAGIYPDKFVPKNKRWPFAITKERAEGAENHLVLPLNAKVRAQAGLDPAWAINDDFADLVGRHGWCARGAEETQPFDFPNWTGRTPADPVGRWAPALPSGWDAYDVRRGRWFRTPNDAILTQISSFEGIQWPVISLRTGIIAANAGAFHPAFAAHVAMGLEGAEEVEAALPAD